MRRVQNPWVGSSMCSGEQLGYAFFHITNLRTNTMEHSSVAKVMSGYYSTRGTVQLKRKGVKDDLGWGGVCGGSNLATTRLPGLLSNQPEVQIIKDRWGLVAHSDPVLID